MYGERSLDYHHLRRYKLRSLTFSEIQVQIINIYGDIGKINNIYGDRSLDHQHIYGGRS